ncbi:MAG: thiamine-phosphate kinase [Candidatus Contendobacter odensis]|uniref:Thiamine-monophosphate kinase n=1 Tax=Candidatus Contendibacter odensensis TaxID=1400860 RepID=A0A2G6PE22_9GAMM|nr:MAG: thiamine-phosphate kinase [Candidatus Contendobacter odensis]
MTAEFSLIDRYFVAHGRARDDVLLGIGDDCALLTPPAHEHLAMTVDTLVENVHFFAAANPENLGHKALAVNLSDLAAMGAMPAWATLALTLPNVDEAWLEAFCRGLFTLATCHQVQLIGGDTTGGAITTITIQASGFVPAGQALRRDGAKPGDVIYVTGTLGDAGLALQVLSGKKKVSVADHGFLQMRLEKPEPRLAQGLALRGIASAAIDVSDGLAQDLGHILSRSQVGARLNVDRLPLSQALIMNLGANSAATTALTSGDDYELCFTVAPAHIPELEAAIAAWDCRCTRIGVIEAAPGLRLIHADGATFELTQPGYHHFA